MPTAIPNGGGEDISTSELAVYNSVVSGTPTAAQAAIAEELEAQVAAIAEGYVDTGGPGGFQRDVAVEALAWGAGFQAKVQKSVREWAGPGRERAQLEMFGSLMNTLIDQHRLILELRERLNASPY